MASKAGRIVSKKRSELGKRNDWIVAVNRARWILNIKGFQAVGGKSAKGQVSALLYFYCDKFSTRIIYIEVYPVDSPR